VLTSKPSEALEASLMSTIPEEPHIVRCRISQEMAFPVGYELLREHFGSTPRWSEARFYFCDSPTTFASKFAHILRSREPYRILRLEHRAEEHVFSHLPAHWCFTIYPVQRDLKNAARTALVDQSFATLHRFIATAPTHQKYSKSVDVILDPSDGTCRAEQLWKI